MNVFKESKIKSPKVSLILLDWSVRESFHICHYLKKQTVPRNQFEVIILEYYSTPSPALLKFEDGFDAIATLDMPKSSYYHKHLMYNIGFLLSKGEIIVICDSDAMAKPTFIESIIKEFEKNPNIFLHLDQFRNSRKDLYPFNYPTFEEVIGEGCINWADGITAGIAATSDILHSRNYGACFCCKREDFIAIGGADEHIDYVGHICGPYDLTFRLSNLGKEEIWHRKEFLYHTWHPGADGINNYLGPHDGRNMSTTALEHIATGRILPHVINPLLDQVLKGKPVSSSHEVCKRGISKENMKVTNWDFLNCKIQVKKKAQQTYQTFSKQSSQLYNQAGKPKLPKISLFFLDTPAYPTNGLFKKNSQKFSLLLTNILLFFYCIRTHIKALPHLNHKRNPVIYYLFVLMIILNKVFISIFRNPKFFANKWNQIISQYKSINSILKVFPNYIETFHKSLCNCQKTIIFAGNELEIEFLKDLFEKIQNENNPAINKLPPLRLQIAPFKTYADYKKNTAKTCKFYFTQSAFNQLHTNKKAAH